MAYPKPVPPPPPIAAITGASSGIGAEFARQLSARGFHLLLIARRLDRMQQLAAALPTPAQCLAADLAEPADRARVAERLAASPGLELLVNNAGFGTRLRFWEADLESQQKMHQLHVLATMEFTHAALKAMTARGRGAVINVASVAAFARSPANVSYCATKAWMLAFTEGLALELAASAPGVSIQALCPGFTYSEFHDVLGVDRNQTAPRSLWYSAEAVVRASLDGLDRKKVVVIPGWPYKLLCAVLPRLPHGLRMALQGRAPHTRVRM